MRKKQSKLADLDYHEGLSENQAQITIEELGLEYREFVNWISGQTCPMIMRYSNKRGKLITLPGVYEYDLFRWLKYKLKGENAIFD